MNLAAAYIFDDTAPLQTATRLRLVTGGGYAANDNIYESGTTQQTLPHPNPLMELLAIRLSPQAGKSLVIPQAGEGANVARCADQTLEDEVGNIKFKTDANGNTSTYIYDGRNSLLTESNPLAAITNYQYDTIGNRTRMEDPEHRITTWAYDLRRRNTRATNGASETTTYTYDGNGNRLSLQRPKNNTWTSVFDAANRLTSITDPLSGSTSYTYDPNNNRTQPARCQRQHHIVCIRCPEPPNHDDLCRWRKRQLRL